MSDKPAYIHHVNFPTTDAERTIEWYSKVFGMKYIKPKSNTKVVLMTRGNFDLHFTPVEAMDRMAPYHFAVEVEDWEGFLVHLDSLGIRHTRVITRPENNSQFCYIHDPDHTMIELVFHARRPYPPVPEKYAAGASAGGPGGAGSGAPGSGAPGSGVTGPDGVAPESAEQAQAALTAADNAAVR
jgi:catechol 2,3-dioxygenase-like lactoylglutathione lyase family enzyme